MVIEGETIDHTATATMDDLKKMETSLTSSIEAQVKGLRDMIAELRKAKDTAPSASTTPETTAPENEEHKDGGGEKQNENEGSSPKPPPPPPKKDENGKDDYRNVPHWYSPDPPIPHPHINHRGEPPKIDASSFLDGNI